MVKDWLIHLISLLVFIPRVIYFVFRSYLAHLTGRLVSFLAIICLDSVFGARLSFMVVFLSFLFFFFLSFLILLKIFNLTNIFSSKKRIMSK